MIKSGRVLWYSDRDQNGIIVDARGNEYYFDISVLLDRKEKIKRNDLVSFKIRENAEILCACSVFKIGE